jgi:hypothetical protein
MDITITATIRDEVAPRIIEEVVARFRRGDWGEAVDADDAALNDADPDNALGSYETEEAGEVWVKADNGHITVLRPGDY